MKRMVLFGIMLLAMMSIVHAATDANVLAINITILTPPDSDSYYNKTSTIRLNASVAHIIPMNITNLTFYLTTGSNITKVTNYTVNGTNTNPTTGTFTFTLVTGHLYDGSYTVIAEARNTSDIEADSFAVNSSSTSFIIDSVSAGIAVTNPLQGSTVVPNSNIVTFDYTPTEPNLGNCTLRLNSQNAKSSSSATTVPNVTTGVNQRFTQYFSADNSSVAAVVRCEDLAGNIGDSSSFTFNVLLGGISPAIRQQQIAASGGSSSLLQQQQKSFTAVPTSALNMQSHLQMYAWIYVVLIVAVGALIWKFKKW